MINLDPQTRIGQLVRDHPGRARVFERLDIDDFPGGRASLATTCAAPRLDGTSVLCDLNATDSRAEPPETTDWIPTTLSAMIDRIVAVHHAYLRRELPRLTSLAHTVTELHGPRHPRLWELRRVLDHLIHELEVHMIKEEWLLFPIIRRVEAAAPVPKLAGGLDGLIRRLEREHVATETALERLRRLTDGYRPPDDACSAYRALLDGLAELELDMQQHFHEENDVLFPTVLEVAEGGPMP